mmetsp:Transcript_21956/g.61015  ORF Transcript_21956/g.61015 Transcript_21956/m.61015 type:complete len:232 (-) Transcript_21956:2473-3168(-)
MRVGNVVIVSDRNRQNQRSVVPTPTPAASGCCCYCYCGWVPVGWDPATVPARAHRPGARTSDPPRSGGGSPVCVPRTRRSSGGFPLVACGGAIRPAGARRRVAWGDSECFGRGFCNFCCKRSSCLATGVWDWMGAARYWQDFLGLPTRRNRRKTRKKPSVADAICPSRDRLWPSMAGPTCPIQPRSGPWAVRFPFCCCCCCCCCWFRCLPLFSRPWDESSVWHRSPPSSPC